MEAEKAYDVGKCMGRHSPHLRVLRRAPGDPWPYLYLVSKRAANDQFSESDVGKRKDQPVAVPESFRDCNETIEMAETGAKFVSKQDSCHYRLSILRPTQQHNLP